MIKVSIVTPTYNAEKFLEKNINSVISQDVKNIEHILVDAMSEDSTLKIVKRYKDHFSKIIIEKDEGIYDGMNKGILASKGELIGILNADDYYSDETINRVLETYERSSKKNVVIYGDMYIEYEKTKVLSRGDLSDSAFQTGKFQINHPTVFVPKSLYDRIGLFDINYSAAADREFLLRAYQNKVEFLKIEHPLATFSLGGFTSSYNLGLLFKKTKEEFRMLKKYYSNWYAIKKTFKEFYRMLRNNFLNNIYGQNKFLDKRIKWLKKND